MLTIHHLGISQSERIIWLCEELGMPYTLVRYDRDPQTRLAPEAYKALHPAGTAPIVTIDGVALAETGAITDYILAHNPGSVLVPKPDDADFIDYLFWLHFANGSMMPRGMARMIAMMISGGSDAGFLGGRIDEAFAMVEDRLGKADYFAGDRFTVADIMMVFSLTTMRRFAGPDLSGSPHTLAYLQRIGARPAYRTAMAKGDPDLPPNLT